MAQHTFIVALGATLSASAVATLSYQVSNQETLTIHRLLNVQTNAWGITAIRDSRGRRYGNFSANNQFPSELLADGANGNNELGSLPMPIVIEGGETIFFEIADGGSGNVMQLMLVGVLDQPG